MLGLSEICFSLWNLDHATCSLRCISLSVLSERVKCRPKDGDAVLVLFFPGEASGGSVWEVGDVCCFVFVYVEALLLARAFSTSANIFATSSGFFPTKMRSSTKMRWESVCGWRVKPVLFCAQVC